MRGANYALLGLVALSCATEETITPLNNELGDFGGSDSGSSGSPGGAGAPTSAGSAVGGGGSSSGTFGTSGSIGFGNAGTFGMQQGGSGGTVAGSGGSSGNASAGSGGKAQGGTGGGAGKAGAGGVAGSGGGSTTSKCGDHAIAAKTQWQATASSECSPTCSDPNGPFTAAMAVDANAGSRFATGKTQTGGEWLQIDLGATATVNHLTINTVSATDYARHYQVRVSGTSNDQAAAVLADADGATGTININLSKTVDGRYVLITQTGTVAPNTYWWSVNDLTISCQ